MTSFELKFDKQKVDTSLAESYLHQNSEFHSSYTDSGEIEYDTHNNKIYLSSSALLSQFSKSDETKPTDNLKKFFRLSQKIEKNLDLFCQLDNLLRKIPIDQVKNYDLKLLIQNLIYHSSQSGDIKPSFSGIIMTCETPLAMLGCIAQITSTTIRITSTKETAAICSLFVNLCHEVGLKEVYLEFVSDSKVICKDGDTINQLFYHSDIEEFRTGGLGIVTEKSDIDSAVDSFLYAPSKYPWQVKKIFVQECALSRFKNSIEWKTKKASGSDVDLIRSCTSVYLYEDKQYLFEFAGNIADISDNSVLIEPYRTNKELIGMMSKIRPLCVSMWSSDIAEANQITYGIDSNIIWINDYGTFEGSPVSSQAFYSVVQRHIIKKSNLLFQIGSLFKNLDYILKLKESWLKLDETERYIKITKAFNDSTGSEDEKFNIDLKLNSNSMISVKNKVCISTRNPEIAYVYINEIQDVFKCLTYILDGGAVILIISSTNDSIKNDILTFCKILNDVKAPVDFIIDNNHTENYEHLTYNTRTVWTSIGTTFAN